MCTYAGPFFGRRGAVELENLEDLIDFAISTEKWFFFDELGEDASDCPNINSQAILFLA